MLEYCVRLERCWLLVPWSLCTLSLLHIWHWGMGVRQQYRLWHIGETPKKVLRISILSNFRPHTSLLLKATEMLQVAKLYVYSVLNFVYKLINNLTIVTHCIEWYVYTECDIHN